MKRFFVVGAGPAQYDLIYKLKRDYRFTVYACSNDENDIAVPLIDGFKNVNITEIDKVVEYARECRADYVYSMGSDLALPAVMAVSNKLGVRTNISDYAIENSLTKEKVRGLFNGQSFNPQYFSLAKGETIKLERIKYPVIVKPVDSQGQRGIKIASNAQQLYYGIDYGIKYSRVGKVIIEQYIDGKEISVNTYSTNRTLKYLFISDRNIHPEYDGGMIKSHVLPAPDLSENITRSIRQVVQKVLMTMKIFEGPAYFQLKIKDNKIYLIEVAPRFDGCHLWKLIQHVYGVDLLDMTIKSIIKTTQSNIYESMKSKASTKKTIEFISKPPGKIFDITEYEKKRATSDETFFYYTDKDIIKEKNGVIEKCGYFIS